jgi:nucleoside-diphosphate-sugar epimerase
MPLTAGHPTRASISLRALASVPVEVRPAPAPLVPWRITGSARHPLARYLNALPRPAGGHEAEVVVLGDNWSRDATVTLLSAVGNRTPAIAGWSGASAPGTVPATVPAPAVPASASARRVVLVHSGAGGGSLLRGLAAERPGLSVHAIEMREPTAAAMRVVARLLGGAPHAEDDLIVHGDGAVMTAGWQAAALPACTPGFAGMTVLVTGGLGDLGVRAAAMLARLGAVPILADIRAPAQAPPGVRRYLEVIRHLTPAAQTVLLDLRDAGLVTDRLTGLRPHAIVHCAGRIAGGTGRPLSADDIQSMISAKVDTLRHVVRAICPDDLRAVLAFGSVTAHGAHPGLYGYALANELLRRETARLAAVYPMTRWCTAEWSLWSGAGMARGVARAAARRLGMVPVPVMTGTSAVVRLLGALTGQAGALTAHGSQPLPQSLVIAGEQSGSESAPAGRPEGLPGIDASLAIPPGADLNEAMLTTAEAAVPGLHLVSEPPGRISRPLSANAVVRAVVCGDVVECVVMRTDPIPGAPLRSGRYRIQPATER